MELRQLRYFIKSAELSNFTEAARTLFISESTLSQQIKQLEIELDTLLFERVRRRVSLTEAGEMFLPYARKTVADSEHAVQRLRDLRNLHTGTLKIGVTFSLGSVLTNSLEKFSQTYPDIKLNIIYRTATELTGLLKTHQVDFVLSYELLHDDDQIESMRLFDSALSVIVHQHHPLAALKRIPLSYINNYPLVLPSVGMNARIILDSVLQASHITLNPQVELNEVNILLQMVRTKHWVTVLSKATIHGDKEMKAIPIQEKGTEMHAALLWLKDGYQKNATREFIRMLMQD